MRNSRTAHIACLLGILAAAGLATQSRAQAPLFPPIPITPDNAPDNTADWFTPFVQYQYTYDNNLFRLPASPADYVHAPGVPPIPPGISLEDHLNTVSAGVDGHWVIGSAILPQQELKDEDWDVGTHLHLANQVLANHFARKHRSSFSI